MNRKIMAIGIIALTGTVDAQTQVPNEFQANTPARAAEVNANFDALEAAIDQSNAQIATLQAQVNALQLLVDNLVAAVQVQGQDVIIEGYNLHVRNGSNVTQLSNGTGNVIIGYNELRNDGTDDRSGSHMLVVGQQNNFTSYGGIIVGTRNTASGRFSSISGGTDSAASGDFSSVSGGAGHAASGLYSSVSGGNGNLASGVGSSVVGGQGHVASGDFQTLP